MADAFEAARQAQISATQNAGQGEKDGVEAMAKNAVSMTEKLVQAIPFLGALLPKMSNAGEVGVFAGIELNKAGIDLNKPMLASSGGMGMGQSLGGIGKAFAAILKKPDFSNIRAEFASAGVSGGESVSAASLGNFTPDFTPSRGPAIGEGMAMA